MLRLGLYFILTFVAGAYASAQELFEYNQSVRALGMGGARVLDETDATMIYWNPAALSQISGIRWNLFNVNLGVPDAKTITDLQGGSVSSLSSLAPYYGKNISLRLAGDSTFAIPYFGIGAYAQAMTNLVLHNPAFTNLNMTYLYDQGYIIGGALPIGPALSVGVSLKRAIRTGGTGSIGASTLASATGSSFLTNLQSTFTATGAGWGSDLGILWKPPLPLNTAFSWSWLDAGMTTFYPTSSNSTPVRIDNNMIFNVNSHADFMGFGFAAGLEYRHIMNQPVQLGKKVHMGLELSMPLVDVRAGFYQGYTSYGIGADLWVIHLDAAQYTIEKGVYPGQTPDNRYEISLSMQMGFDANFGLTDLGGKRRKLKQRR